MKLTDQPHLFTSAVSDQGMQRKNNEDRYGVSAFVAGQTPSVLAIVCDGIGGHLAGEVAAELAVSTLTQVVAQSDASNPLETLGQAIQAANQAVQQASQEQPERRGMGATCVIAWIIGNRLYTTSVGDSPLFMIRNRAIQRLTTPHTWVQEAVEAGVLTEAAARVHPNAHVIRRYLGMAEPITLDFRLKLQPGETDEQSLANQGITLQAGDILLMCSDGLTDMVETEAILATIVQKGRAEGVPALLELANANGGMDNITIVAVEVPGAQAAAQTLAQAPAATDALNAKTVQIERSTRRSETENEPLQTGLGRMARSKTAWLGCAVIALLAAVVVTIVLIFGVLTLQNRATPTATTGSTPIPALQLTMEAVPDPGAGKTPVQADQPAVTNTP